MKHFAINADVGPALGRAACHFESGHREYVRGLLILAEAGLEPTPSLAALVEELGDVARTATDLADNYAAHVASGTYPILTDGNSDSLPPWVNSEMFARAAAEWRAEMRRKAKR